MSTTVSKLDEIKTGPWNGGVSPLNAEYGKLMMWFFLLSDAFTFSALLIYYGAQRFSNLSWPDPDTVFQSVPGVADHGYPLVFVGIMTFILIMSSVTMVLAVSAGHNGQKKQVINYLILTIIGGFIFLGCQAAEWTHLHHEGYWWGSIPEHYNAAESVGAQQFANLFFTITGFHGFHVFSGIILNIVILFMTMGNVFEKRGTYIMVEKVGLYWHFVDLVWVFVFTFFYLV